MAFNSKDTHYFVDNVHCELFFFIILRTKLHFVGEMVVPQEEKKVSFRENQA